jgi:hypothetical protein
MVLSFEIGKEEAPRGHALVYFHDSSITDQLLATYFIVLPVALDLSKYMPPMFAAQMGSIGVDEVAAFAVPPIPDKAEDYSKIRRLAELRNDDLLYGGSINSKDFQGMVSYVNEIVEAYAHRYVEFQKHQPKDTTNDHANLEVNKVLYELMGVRGRLEELAKLLGKLRFAVEGADQSTSAATEREIRALAEMFPEHYKMNALIAATQTANDGAGKLAQLYLDRCYRLSEEDFDGLKKLDQLIGDHLNTQ